MTFLVKFNKSVTMQAPDDIQTDKKALRLVRQKFLTIRATNAWNQFPAEVVNAPSPNAFKTRLDKAWNRWKHSQQPLNEFSHYGRATSGRSLSANRLYL